jgi:flagellar biosynthesis activator protein FlaF
MSIKAYQNAQDKVTDPRRIEIMMFQKCNALLSAAAAARTQSDNGDEALAMAKCEAQALFENDKLWGSLLADLAGEENQLPAALRARLISLGLWAFRHTDKIRAEKASFDPLINLNDQMIVGLTASLDAARGQAPAVAAAPTAT